MLWLACLGLAPQDIASFPHRDSRAWSEAELGKGKVTVAPPGPVGHPHALAVSVGGSLRRREESAHDLALAFLKEKHSKEAAEGWGEWVPVTCLEQPSWPSAAFHSPRSPRGPSLTCCVDISWLQVPTGTWTLPSLQNGYLTPTFLCTLPALSGFSSTRCWVTAGGTAREVKLAPGLWTSCPALSPILRNRISVLMM